MLTTLARRVTKLESSAAARVTIYAWQDEGETAEQAIARQYPKGVAEGATVIVYRWGTDK